MAFYGYHDLTLALEWEKVAVETELQSLLRDLSFLPTDASSTLPSLRLSVQVSDHPWSCPSSAHEVFHAEGLSGREDEEGFYLTEGSSLLHLRASEGRAVARLAASFFRQPSLLLQRFWTVGLLRLIRPLGLYVLHAAALVRPDGLGMLMVGESGSGKSTLAIGLIRQGWGYLSDDSVLLRQLSDEIHALALRRPFSVDPRDAERYADLALPAKQASPGKQPSSGVSAKRRIEIRSLYPNQFVPSCLPQVLLFLQLVPNQPSQVRPLSSVSALRILLAQSAPPLFDRHTMSQHLEVLKGLVQGSRCLELLAGPELVQYPEKLTTLLAEAEGDEHGSHRDRTHQPV